MKSKIDYIKLPKDEITEVENELYNFNSKIVSLLWIGAKHKPEEEQIFYLNKLLGKAIRLLREIRDNG